MANMQPIASPPPAAATAAPDLALEQEAIDALREGLASGLKVTSDDDRRVTVALRKPGDGVVFAALLVTCGALQWWVRSFSALQDAGAFGTTLLALPWIAALLIGAALGFHGRRLIVTRGADDLVHQWTWLGVSMRSERLAAGEIIGVSVRGVDARDIQGQASSDVHAGLAFMAAHAIREFLQGSHDRASVSSIELTMRGARVIRVMFTRSEADCRGAVLAISRVLGLTPTL